MSALGHVLWNLMVNGAITFLLAFAIVQPATLWLRRRAGLALLIVLLLPLVKVFWDAAQGVPLSSFLWAKLAAGHQDLGSFRAGIGLSRSGVKLDLRLAAFSGGVVYPQSAADILDAALSKRLAAWAPGALALACLVIGLLRRVLSVWRARRFIAYATKDARVLEWRLGVVVLGELQRGLDSVRSALNVRPAGRTCVEVWPQLLQE